MRGDYPAARDQFEACSALTAPDEHGVSRSATMWFAAQLGMSETWLALGDASRARSIAAAAIEEAARRGVGSRAIELVRVLALAEAKLGEAGAVERLEASIAEQNRIGSTGLQLGLSYEARAQIAIWQADSAAFERYAELTAREYRYGGESGLGARYDRLINEAGRYGLRASAVIADFAGVGTSALESSQITRDDPGSLVMRSMARTRHGDERAQAALELICASRNASCGHLYMTSETGLVLSATRGDRSPLPDLDALHDFVSRSEDREGAIDDMATGDLLEERPMPLTEAGGTTYELLLLSYTVDGEAKVVGVAAVGATHV